jgi:serine phosphatase RsbU (regulator of sigma subunit)
MLFAVADCTGHGVPGAFLSLIDLALCSYDYNNRVLEYAGAFNSLYIVRDQTIIGIRPAIFSSS